jgi:branched-chain amino acid transport system substrate-binding protein
MKMGLERRGRRGVTTIEYAIIILLIVNIVVSAAAIASVSRAMSAIAKVSEEVSSLSAEVSTGFSDVKSGMEALSEQMGEITGVVVELTKPPTPGEAFKPTEIKIGLVEPLTGAYAVFGTEAKQAAELIIEDINNKGGIKNLKGAKLTLVVEDSKSTVDGAKLAAQRLVSVELVPIILGAYISRHTGGMLDITEPAKVIVVADALVDYLTEQGEYIFRVCPKNSAHAVTNVNFIYEMLKRAGIDPKTVSIAIINEDSIFGKLGGLAAEERAATLGMNVVDRIEYPYDIADMTPIVSRLMEKEVDIVIDHPYFGDALLFAKTVHDLGWKPMFIAGQGACGFADPESIEAGGVTVEYITQTYSYSWARNTAYNNWFVSEFEERYGKKPTEAGGIVAYSLWVIKEVLELYGEMFPEDETLDPDHLREAFLSLEITSGPAADLYPTGRIEFNEVGDNAYAGAVIYQVIEGDAYLVWPLVGAQRDAIFPRPD